MNIIANKISIVIGRRGSGKTDFLKQLIRKSPLAKKLIVDTFDSETWHNLETHDWKEGKNIAIPSLSIEQFPLWNMGIYRLWGKKTKEIMKVIDDYARNSLIVFDDATKYISSKLDDSIKDFILDSKQKNLNLVFVFHSMKDVPKDLIRYCDYITIFKVNENLTAYYKQKFPDHFVPAFESVKLNSSDFANLTIDIQRA